MYEKSKMFLYPLAIPVSQQDAMAPGDGLTKGVRLLGATSCEPHAGAPRRWLGSTIHELRCAPGLRCSDDQIPDWGGKMAILAGLPFAIIMKTADGKPTFVLDSTLITSSASLVDRLLLSTGTANTTGRDVPQRPHVWTIMCRRGRVGPIRED